MFHQLLSWLLTPSPVAAGQVCQDVRLQPAPAQIEDVACMEVAEGLALCFSCGDTLITTAQQQTWGISLEELEDRARTASADAISPQRPLRQAVADSPGHHYWLSAERDGYDAAALLHPEALASEMGGSPVIGIPGKGALIAWIPGDEDLDLMVAIGIKTMHEQAAHPISSKVYQYKDGAWIVWGETRRADPF